MAISQPTESFLPSNLEASQFTLQNDHSLFTILRKNIYSNVILAGIRELSTNAIDACVEADMDINWEVHIPTIEEPFFAIRDYGPGMTLDFLQGDFTVVGASSKRNSNKTNGQFGLGRLSPLAYTSSFTVESWNNGMYYSYLVSLQDGIPSAVQLVSQPSSEPSGCKFSFAVEPTDIRKFQDEAANLFKYFTNKPNKVNIELPTPLVTLDSDYYMLTQDRSGIVMANVYYSFNSHIRTNYFGLVLKVPTGSVSLTPGRESLNYDDATTTYLEEMVAEAEKDIIENLNLAIQQAPTEWEKAKIYITAYHNSPYGEKKKLNHHCTSIKPNDNIILPCIEGEHLFLPSYRSKAYNLANSYCSTDSIFETGNILLVDSHRYTHVYDVLPPNLYIIKPKDLDTAKQQLTTLGVPFTLSSEVEAPEKEKTSRKRKLSITLRHIYSTVKTDYTESMGTIYYVPYSGTTSTVLSEYALLTFIKHFKFDIPIYGIAESHLSKIKDNENFINFYEHLRELEKTRSFFIFNKVQTHYYIPNENLVLSPANPLTSLKVALEEDRNLRNYPSSNFVYVEDWLKLKDYITLHVYDYKFRYNVSAELKKYPLIEDLRYTTDSNVLHYLKLEHFYENHLSQTSG